MANMRKIFSKISKSIMKSYPVQIPKYDLPVRLRPWFVVFTCVIMVVLGFLGFTNFSRSLFLNDKLLHFLCFCIATLVFYFIVDVEENARRIWFWRHSGLIFTAFTCGLCGGVFSEVVQALIPYKVFDWGDIIANLIGSSLGLYIAYHLERYYRHRREIARLYRPLSGSTSDYEDEDEDEDEASSTQLLPIHNGHNTKGTKNSRLADVWDEREELFSIDESEEGNNQHPRPSALVNTSGTSRAATTAEPPRIIISHS